MDDDFKQVRKKRFKSNTPIPWKSISGKPRSISDKHQDIEPKWYVLKINYTREKSILKQIQELIDAGNVLDYKKVSELSGNIIVKYKLLFIKMILNHRNINAIRKVQYTYGFYLSNKNIITFNNIECHQKTELDYSEKIQDCNEQKQEKIVNNSTELLVKGQYVTINKGFFAGSKGKVVAINQNIISVEVDFYYNTIITTEVDISNIVIN